MKRRRHPTRTSAVSGRAEARRASTRWRWRTPGEGDLGDEIIDAAKVVVPDHAFFFVFAHRAECSQSQEQRSKLGSVIGASSTSPGQADSASVPTVHGTWARARPSASRS